MTPVHDRSTPVKQEETAVQTFEVSAEVYMAMEHERSAVNMTGGQPQVPSGMRLDTQVDSGLSCTELSSLALPQGTDDTSGLCLEVDSSQSMGSSSLETLLGWRGASIILRC